MSEVMLRVGHLKTCGVIWRFIDTIEVRCSCRASKVKVKG
jgi:hypothetical protein